MGRAALFGKNAEDDTDRIVSDMRHGHDKQAREAKPAKVKLTPLQDRVLRKVDGVELPFVSNVLVYSRATRALPKVEQKALYSLVRVDRCA